MSRIRRIALATTAVLAVALAGTASPPVAAAANSLVNPQVLDSVPGHDYHAPAAPALAIDKHRTRPAGKPSWPAAGRATVDLPATTSWSRAGKLPVWVARGRPPAGAAGAGAAEPVTGGVTVEMADQKAAGRLGVRGVVFRLTRPSAPSDSRAAASLRFDYSGFRSAYGADYGSRLRLVALPACALSTPDRTECRTGTPVASRNDTRTHQVSADVQVGASAVFALAASAGGNAGSFAATTLSTSATWTAGGSSGGFTWSYPMRVPPAQGGPVPQVGLSYSSSAVDGHLGSTNNQPSWIGEGWDYWPGYIERSYASCSDDTAGGGQSTGDECWKSDNALVNLGGQATELVHDGSGLWRPADDNGERVEQLFGAQGAFDNGTYNREYWRITTPDGTQYYFGLNRLPGWQSGNAVTNSAWTAPVYGNDAGEPCHASTFAASSCVQGWRWNLDYVVDPHGNSLTYYYKTETGYYAQNGNTASPVGYIRGGTLAEADYGTRTGQEYGTTAPERVVFGVDERCLPTSTVSCAESQLNSSTASSWPDVPYDQNCTAGTTCNIASPTFWTRKRLTSVTTQVLVNGSYQPVDSWQLTHTFPNPGDGSSAALWLRSVQQTGHGAGTSDSLPAVTFDGAQMDNRVDPQDGLYKLVKYRISAIHGEAGATTSVTYYPTQCSRLAGQTPVMPSSQDSNTLRCFPEYRPDRNIPDHIDWFHKYVVHEVADIDNTTGAPGVKTTYNYLGDPAWHYDDTELVPAGKRTWSQWRGYGQVQVLVGATQADQTRTDYRYFRGMNGDHLANGSTRSVSVTDSEGTSLPDNDELDGFTREQIVYNGVNGGEVTGTINDPWSLLTALRDRTGTGLAPLAAHVVETGSSRTRTALSTGGYRRTETDTTFDNHGLVTQVNDLADTGTAADDRCTRTTYAPNTAAWLLNYPSRVETVGVACTATAHYPDDAISDVRNYYDGSTTFGTAPTAGDATRVERVASYSGGNPVYVTKSRTVFDANGRPTETYDAANNETTTAYTPATGGPVTKTVVTDPKGYATATTLDPFWGMPTSEVDANGRRTDLGYDMFGRLASVWSPDRPKSANPDNPSIRYAYQIRTNGPTVVSTQTINSAGTGYNTTYTLYDSLFRTRQVQAPDASGGSGRQITDTQYDARGLTAKQTHPYFNADSGPGTNLFVPTKPTDVPADDSFGYDGAERPLTDVFDVHGQEQWRTTTSYGGDHIDVTSPTGGTGTSTYADARGQKTELRQYHGTNPTGTYDSTRYTYTPAGALATITGPDNAVWRYHYDVRGRQIQTDDPDKGTSHTGYNDLDQVTSTTDARGQTLAYSYDVLGRKTGMYSGSTSGPLLASWAYDGLAKGQPDSSTRYDANGNAYTSAVTGYDAAYRPLGTTVTIPASEGKLAGSYTSTTTYTPGGQAATVGFPAAGNLAAETVTNTYTPLGQPSTAASPQATYVASTGYTQIDDLTTLVLGATSHQVGETYTYEDSGRLHQALITRDATPFQVSNRTYSYNPAGDITRIADTPSGGTPDNQCFRYDYLRRLTNAWTPASGDCSPDPTSTTLGGAAPYWQSWTYDTAGDRLTQTDHATTSGGADTTETSTYPTAGQPQPHAVQSLVTTGPAGSRTDTYSYDANGATTARPGPAGTTETLGWDAEGHLASVTSGGQTTTYLYDADGNRLLARDPGGATLYLGSQDLRYDRATDTVTTSRYYTFGGQTIAVRTGTGLSWQIDDQQGTGTVALSSTDLTKATWRRQTPFGQVRGANPSTWPGDRAFLTAPTDPTTGLTHLGARDYDPTLGRFLSVDPTLDTTSPQELNGYAYSANDPTTHSDSTGQMLCLDEGSCGAGLGDDWHRQQQQNAAEDNREYGEQWANYHGQPAKPKKHGCGGWYHLACHAKHAAKAAVAITVASSKAMVDEVQKHWRGLLDIAAFGACVVGTAIACVVVSLAVLGTKATVDTAEGKHVNWTKVGLEAGVDVAFGGLARANLGKGSAIVARERGLATVLKPNALREAAKAGRPLASTDFKLTMIHHTPFRLGVSFSRRQLVSGGLRNSFRNTDWAETALKARDNAAVSLLNTEQTNEIDQSEVGE